MSLIVQSAAEIEAQRPLTNLNSEICVGSTCPEDIMRAHVMAQLTDELARRAVYSSDPRLYGLAFKMCRLFVSVPACSSLNVWQWARLDPENGAPWLYALDDNSTGKMSQNLDKVLF